MRRDLRSNLNAAQSIAPQAVTAALNGAGVDCANFASVEIELNLGTFAGTTPSMTLKIQESADNSTFTDVATAELNGGALPTIDTSNDVAILTRGYLGGKRYLRVRVDAISGAGASLPMAATIRRGNPRKAPQQ